MIINIIVESHPLCKALSAALSICPHLYLGAIIFTLPNVALTQNVVNVMFCTTMNVM